MTAVFSLINRLGGAHSPGFTLFEVAGNLAKVFGGLRFLEKEK